MTRFINLDKSIPKVSSEAEEAKLILKVWVDIEKKQALFAEVDSEFVDILFSFLTLPLGTIVKLLSENSGMQSIDNLYKSIQNLEDKHWWTVACRNMLLSPHSVAGEHCEELKININNDPNPRELYHCKRTGKCVSNSIYYYSHIRDTICYYCGGIMKNLVLLEKANTEEDDGVFIQKNSSNFIIADDFSVKQVSAFSYYDIMKEFDIEDLSLKEVRTYQFGRTELLYLLKKLIEGKKVLTRICFPDLCIQSTTDKMKMNNFESKDNAQHETEKLQIKLLLNRTNNNVVCAELEDEFSNQLFSFLTFPLGSVLKFIDHSNSLGCMSNLLNSIQELKYNCFISDEAKEMLISPQVPNFFGYNKQMLFIKEETPKVVQSTKQCMMCKKDNKIVAPMSVCDHGTKQPSFEEINPKLAKRDKNLDGRFVREAQIFLATDDLHITSLSGLSFDQILKKQGVTVDHLEKREMSIGKAQVVNLLRAMLVSKTVLSDALIHCAK